LAAAKRAAQDRFRGRTGRIIVRCGAECAATLDGQPITAGIPMWTLIGNHSIIATRGSTRRGAMVDVAPQRLAEVTLDLRDEASPTSAPPRPATTSGVSPTWVWIGAGATVLLGGASILSGVKTLGHSDDFDKAGCEKRGSDACDSIAADGRSAQL